MADRVTVAGDVSEFAGLPLPSARGTDGQSLAEQRPHRLERRLVTRDQIELGAIAGGEQHATTRAGRHHARERARHFVRAVRKPLSHIQRRGPVVYTNDLDAPSHRYGTRHRNRSAPGWVSFSATYTSNTAEKPAILASAARRPAQRRTTRTQTAQPSTTQVKMPHTIWALAAWRSPANCAP